MFFFYNIVRDYNAYFKTQKKQLIYNSLSISTAIFILIILVSFGNSLKNGMTKSFNFYSGESILISGGKINQSNKTILFDNNDLRFIKLKFNKSIKCCSPFFFSDQNIKVSNQKSQILIDIDLIDYNFFQIMLNKIEKGRNFNKLDNFTSRNVCIVGNTIYKKLNKKKVIGTFLLIKKKYYKIIGVLKKSSILNPTVDNTVYLPLDKNKIKFHSIGVLFKSTNEITKTVDEIQNSLCRLKGISLKNKNAINIYNSNSQSKVINNLFDGINSFIWLIGISLLFVGMIGTSNIMLMKIKERQQEIAIRKALGANSKIIISMILFESILIASIGGGIGILLGKLVIFTINLIFINPVIDNEDFVFGLLEINNWAIVSVYFIIIISGIIGGIVPALRASKFSIIESINKDI